MKNKSDLTEVVCFTWPAAFLTRFRQKELLYDRVVEVALPEFTGICQAGLDGLESNAYRSIFLPKQIASRLLHAVQVIDEDKETVNCHRFSRMLTGQDMPGNYKSEYPVHQKVSSLPRVDYLQLGQIGLIGAESTGAMHSIIGLGEDETEALQVMSARSEIGLAPNKAVLDFYSQLHPGEDVGLYAA